VFPFEEIRIASFEEFVIEAKKHNIKMFVELKEVRNKTQILVDEFIRILHAHDYKHQIVLLSFFPGIISRVKSIDPTIYATMLYHPTGLSIWCSLKVHSDSLVWRALCYRPDLLDDTIFNFVLPVASWFQADAVGLAVPTITKNVINRFQSYGFGVFAWTVNTSEEKSHLAAEGARILISDCPGASCESVMNHMKR
jgi:glycerophosphoryl diester phosphodiesterase